MINLRLDIEDEVTIAVLLLRDFQKWEKMAREREENPYDGPCWWEVNKLTSRIRERADNRLRLYNRLNAARDLPAFTAQELLDRLEEKA